MSVQYSPYHIINERSSVPLVLVADHASNFIPRDMKDLGLEKRVLETHAALDIGVNPVIRAMAEKLGCSAILANFSRLITDPNRWPHQEGFTPEKADDVLIPGNRDLDPIEVKVRQQRFFDPFHQAVSAVIEDHLLFDRRPAVVSLHSFTPVFEGKARPWPVGVMWNNDETLARKVGEEFAQEINPVGWNEPYSGKEYLHTLTIQAELRNLPYVQIEIRNDQLAEKSDQVLWTDRISDILKKILKI